MSLVAVVWNGFGPISREAIEDAVARSPTPLPVTFEGRKDQGALLGHATLSLDEDGNVKATIEWLPDREPAAHVKPLANFSVGGRRDRRGKVSIEEINLDCKE